MKYSEGDWKHILACAAVSLTALWLLSPPVSLFFGLQLFVLERAPLFPHCMNERLFSLWIYLERRSQRVGLNIKAKVSALFLVETTER